MSSFPIPKPLIDTLLHTQKSEDNNRRDLIYPSDWNTVINFLRQYDGNQQTFNAYRRELERLLQWSWLISTKSILNLKRKDIENYLQFCLNPPRSWIGTKRLYRFVEKNGERIPNPKWRPFVVTVTKAEYKEGIAPDKSKYHLSPKAIREIFTVLNSFYNTLLVEEKVTINPVMLVKQKSRYIQKQQTQKQILRLTDEQWEICVKTINEMAENNELYQRILFIMSAMYLMYLRISEFVATKRWIPSMNHFYQDSDKKWWFKTLGKGNKLRTIAVSNAMLEALKKYRISIGLSSLPSPSDNSPLIPKLKGHGPIEDTRHLRNLIQECYDRAGERLREQGKINEANSLGTATVHWLRHTGISDDINKRGRSLAHVRDDAGHTSVSTTDRYNDVEVKKRHASAIDKKMIESSQEKLEAVNTSTVTVDDIMKTISDKLPYSPKEKITKLGPDNSTKKHITLKMHFYIENNNKFVRGKSRSLKDIELWVFSQYNIKTVNKKSGDYEITLEYTTYKDLDDQLYEVIRESDSIADSRNGFTEFDIYTFDGEDSWPFSPYEVWPESW